MEKEVRWKSHGRIKRRYLKRKYYFLIGKEGDRQAKRQEVEDEKISFWG